MPKDLQALADGYMAKRKAGTVQVRRGRAAWRDLCGSLSGTNSGCPAEARPAQALRDWWLCACGNKPLLAVAPERRCLAGRKQDYLLSEMQAVCLARVLAGVCSACDMARRTWVGG